MVDTHKNGQVDIVSLTVAERLRTQNANCIYIVFDSLSPHNSIEYLYVASFLVINLFLQPLEIISWKQLEVGQDGSQQNLHLDHPASAFCSPR